MEKMGNENGEEFVHPTQLPNDVIIQQILPWLPIKKLTQCKLVSKDWNSCISDPNYILYHFHKSVFSHPFSPLETLFIQSGNSYFFYCLTHDDDDDNVEASNTNNLVKLDIVDGSMASDIHDNNVYVVGCSNGLVCLVGTRRNYISIWNPSTKQSHNYYPPDFHLLNSYVGSNCPVVSWGFGYVSSRNDYKVVRVLIRLTNSGQFSRSVVMFSLRSNTWTKIGCGLFEWGSCHLVMGRPRLVNETLYWGSVNGVVVAFDLGVKTFHIFPHLGMESHKDSEFYVMGGCLSKWSRTTPDADNDFVLDIVKPWGQVVSVRLQCGLRQDEILQLTGFTKTGKIVAACCNPNRLCLIDPYSVTPLVTLEEDKGSVFIESYVPSQISPLPPMESQTASGQVG